MTGFYWTYDQLSKAVPKLTAHSSSPISAADLNPIIKGLLTICPDSSICDIGGHSVLLSFPSDTVAKVSLIPNSEHLRHEQSMFDLLDQTPCPFIVQTFLRCPDIIFMERLNEGNLHDRISCLAKTSSHQMIQWIQQLSDAAAWIESQGRVHGDINPRNILFKKDKLKLVDFDHSLKIKEPLDVGYEPYVRGCWGEGGNFGVAGPRTEQFALGSIFWYMTRGTELYYELEGRERVNRLIDRQFPATKPQDPIDCVISDCWLGNFKSIAEVSMRVHEIATFDTSEEALGETYLARKEECGTISFSGLYEMDIIYIAETVINI